MVMLQLTQYNISLIWSCAKHPHLTCCLPLCVRCLPVLEDDAGCDLLPHAVARDLIEAKAETMALQEGRKEGRNKLIRCTPYQPLT